jgi:hypothetical protein
LITPCRRGLEVSSLGRGQYGPPQNISYKKGIARECFLDVLLIEGDESYITAMGSDPCGILYAVA